MEKALKLLNRKLEIAIMHLYGSSGICFVKDIKELEEAIAELEEAMKPKTCEGCKHYEEKQCTNENSIAFGGINAVYKDDFCNDFEPKEQL